MARSRGRSRAAWSGRLTTDSSVRTPDRAVLIVTSGEDAHVGLVRPLLDAAGARCVVLDTDALGAGCAIHVRPRDGRLEVTFELAAELLHGRDVGAVWWRRPGLPLGPLDGLAAGARRFAEQEWTRFVQGALRLLDCHWVSHPDAIRAAGYKLVQLARAADHGLRIPDTYAGASPAALRPLAAGHGQIVAKVVGHGPPIADDSEPAYRVPTQRFDAADLPADAAIAAAPAIYQGYVRKRRDVRVTVVGDTLHAATIHSQGTPVTEVDWRRADAYTLPHARARLPDAVAERCLALTHAFGLRFAAIDLILTPDGEYVFLELNPNGQWGWIQELTGLPIAESLCAELLGR